MELEEPSNINDPENDNKKLLGLLANSDEVHFWINEKTYKKSPGLGSEIHIHLEKENDNIVYWIEEQKEIDGDLPHYKLPESFEHYNTLFDEITNEEKKFDQSIAADLILCIKRDTAARYIADCKQAEPDQKPLPTVHFFYNADEYTEEKTGKGGITPEKYITNLHLASTQGGASVITDFGISKRRSADQNTNPLGINKYPDHNTWVAVDCELTGYGGYFNTEETTYSKSKIATVVVANGYEFENFSAQAFRDGECPFISTQKSNQFSHPLNTVVLATSDNKQTWHIKSKASVTPNEEEQSLYFDKAGFQAYIRDKVIQQLQAITEAHTKSGQEGGIEVNLCLSGLGYFANLGGKQDCSIAADIAETMAQGYKDAIAVMGTSQAQDLTQDETYIAGVRFSASLKNETDALQKVFEFDDEPKRVSDITITQTAHVIEYMDDSEKSFHQAIILSGDARANPGNEKWKTDQAKAPSQEPGVFRWIKNGRQLFNPLFNPTILKNVQEISLTDAQKQSIKFNKIRQYLEEKPENYHDAEGMNGRFFGNLPPDQFKQGLPEKAKALAEEGFEKLPNCPPLIPYSLEGITYLVNLRDELTEELAAINAEVDEIFHKHAEKPKFQTYYQNGSIDAVKQSFVRSYLFKLGSMTGSDKSIQNAWMIITNSDFIRQKNTAVLLDAVIQKQTTKLSGYIQPAFTDPIITDRIALLDKLKNTLERDNYKALPSETAYKTLYDSLGKNAKALFDELGFNASNLNLDHIQAKKTELSNTWGMSGIEIGVRLGIGLALGVAVGVALGFLTFGIAPLAIAGIAAAVFVASVVIPKIIEIAASKINAPTETDNPKTKENEDMPTHDNYKDKDYIVHITKKDNLQTSSIDIDDENPNAHTNDEDSSTDESSSNFRPS